MGKATAAGDHFSMKKKKAKTGTEKEQKSCLSGIEKGKRRKHQSSNSKKPASLLAPATDGHGLRRRHSAPKATYFDLSSTSTPVSKHRGKRQRVSCRL